MLLGFSKQFADEIRSGRKRQTIRAHRKDGRRPKLGEQLHLYASLRTKQVQKLLQAECVAVMPVEMDLNRCAIVVAGKALRGEALADFARLDGFANSAELFAWFKATHGGSTFSGWCCRWKP